MSRQRKNWNQLSVSEVMQIRQSDLSTKVLAIEYNRTPRQIRYIRAKKSWRFATD